MHRRSVTILRSGALTAFALATLLCVGAGAGFAEEAIPTITAEALLARIESGAAPVVLDVRSDGEYASAHVPGAIHIPFDQVAERVSELGGDRAAEIVIYCESGRRAGRAESTLRSNGFTGLVHLVGDMRGWRERGLRCEGETCGAAAEKGEAAEGGADPAKVDAAP